MIGRRSVLVFVANAVSGVLGYIGILVVARFTHNPEELLGVVGFGLGFVGSFFVLTSLGIRSAHIKRVSQGEPLSECMGTYALLQVIQAGLAAAATLFALFLWTQVLQRGFETPLHQRVILIMLVYFLATAVANYANTSFNARLQTAKSQTTFLVGTIARVGGMVAVAVAGLGALALAWAYALGAVAVAGVALVLLRTYPIGRPNRKLMGSYIGFAWPLALPATLVALSGFIDKAVLQLFWGATQVGYYFTIQRLVLTLTVVTSGVSLLLFPSISRYHASDDVATLRDKSQQAERYMSMILAPVVGFLIVYPEGVIHVLLSDAFLPAAGILRLFAASVFVLALITPRRAILTGMDRSGLAGLSGLAGSLATLSLYFILIPKSILGIPFLGLAGEGAVLSVIVGNSVYLLVALAFSHRLVGDRLHLPILYHVATAALLAVLFAFLVPPTSGVEWRWFQLIPLAVVFLGAYLGLLAVLREFRRPDLHLFLDLLNPRKLARYVQGELRDVEER